MPKDLKSYVKTKRPLDDFSAAVIRLILTIPRGKVATYGQLAELAGHPGRSRQVGFILRTIVDADRVPWQRVIGATGRISFPRRNKNHKLQRKLLEREGVVFTGVRVDLEQYRWRRRVKTAGGRVQPRLFNY